MKQAERKVFSHPTISTDETLKTIGALGDTERFDAALLLIRYLAVNLNPVATNEPRTPAELIPAIGILREHYGEDIMPLLFAAGIATEHEWMRARCALAAREIGTPERLLKMRGLFSLKETASPRAIAFRNVLTMDSISLDRLGIGDPGRRQAEEITKSLRKGGDGR